MAPSEKTMQTKSFAQGIISTLVSGYNLMLQRIQSIQVSNMRRLLSSEVDLTPNGVAAEKEDDGAIIVHTLEQEGNVLSDAMISATHVLTQHNVMFSTDFGRDILETMQNVMILPDEDFDGVVRVDLQLIKQAWTDKEKGETPFITVISKSQRKKIKQLARSRGQPYNTRSRDNTSHELL
ncbi:hypothetical protein L195_g026994 [Trifolium pratense]|uniref:Uncharacterized protein n=1 Tax=Trifolium pratense TaxID=57577 RepID=A0A2K3KXW8_TRIPR|nr:hypothetical protein L195_g026994 [Trifolium pratense]